MGQLVASLRYAHLVVESVPVTPAQLSSDGRITTIQYDLAQPPPPLHAAEATIVDHVIRAHEWRA